MGKKILVVGAGYVGIPTSVHLSRLGHDVLLADNDTGKVAELNKAICGALPKDLIGEPGMNKALQEGNIKVVYSSGDEDLVRIMDGMDVVVICVGTPLQEPGGTKDPSMGPGPFNMKAVHEIAVAVQRIDNGPAVVIRSTVDPDWAVALQVLSNRFFVFPEFLREGHALEDSKNPTRWVLGGPSKVATEEMAKTLIGETESPVFLMTASEASITKLASNGLLSLKISLANLVSAWVGSVPNGDIARVSPAVEADPRLGTGAFAPGLGPMGPCLPKDGVQLEATIASLPWPEALTPLKKTSFLFTNLALISSSIPASEVVFGPLNRHNIKGGVLFTGVGFKPSSTDFRTSPCLGLAAALSEKQKVIIWDPRLGPGEADAIVECIKDQGGDAKVENISFVTGDVFPPQELWEAMVVSRDVDLSGIPVRLDKAAVLDPFNLVSDEDRRGLLVKGYCVHGNGRSFVDW